MRRPAREINNKRPYSAQKQAPVIMVDLPPIPSATVPCVPMPMPQPLPRPILAQDLVRMPFFDNNSSEIFL
jgi:hypothetical protein